MLPTIQEGELLLIEEVPVSKLERGDLIVFKAPGRSDLQLLKRLIGLPGETIEVRDGKVYINDNVLDEPYITYIKRSMGRDFSPITLGPDEYFVLGDNRPNSSDSRGFGPISGASILGRVKQ